MSINKRTPFFSVITVCYNAEADLEQTIKSVLTQSFQDFEYIIIDGGSTDGTLNIIHKYSSRIKFISEVDNGIYDACNKGIQLSNGKFINILMAGDYHKPDFLKENFNHLEFQQYDFIYGGVIAIKPNGKSFVNIPNDLKELNQIIAMPFAHPTLIVNGLLAKSLRFNEMYRYAADFDFVCKLFENDYLSINTKKPLTVYAMGGVGNSYKSIFETFKIQRKHKILKLNSAYILLKMLIYTFLIRNRLI